MKDLSGRDRTAHRLAREFIVGLDGVTAEILELHLAYPDSGEVKSLGGVLERLLESAQSAAMKPKVIGGSLGEGGVNRLGEVLFGFDPHRVSAHYAYDADKLLDSVVGDLRPTGAVRRTPKSIWPRFCATALSGAAFLSQFEDWSEFDSWVRTFDDPRSRAALPMLLSNEIYGIGFALACDFIKELGYTGYCKPDTHVIKSFVALGLTPSASVYDVFRSVVRMAEHTGDTPYRIDKLIWLIGSGRFYRSRLEIGGHREEFVKFALKQLGIDPAGHL